MSWLQPLPRLKPPQHGGDLQRAKRQYPQISDWLDLSAALNPNPWPVPEIPLSCFQQLPDGYEELLQAAADYYGVATSDLWPVNGSQQGIELLPQLFCERSDLRSRKRIAVPEEGYQEHAWCWQKAGFAVYRYRADSPEALVAIAGQCDLLVVINPNNPTGCLFDRSTLLACHQQLQSRGGWLVVDEAFMDAYPPEEQNRYSVSGDACDSLVVLRSVGKFFGLAGIRSGFVLSGPDLTQRLKTATGPWPVSGVTAWLTQQMLQDGCWQQAARQPLQRAAASQLGLLQQVFFEAGQWASTPLFVSFVSAPERAAVIQSHLAEQGIWVRRFQGTGRLRMGVPAEAEARARLQSALLQV